jgi:phage host-nuclease inhibitor protein Gam
MKTFKLENDHIGFIGFEELEYTTAIRALHEMIENNQDWVNDYPKAKWNVNLFDGETGETKIVYTLTTAKIKKLQKDGLF